MSCSDPNLQQVTGSVKHLIVPPEGYGIITADYSQIEFRVIVHYLENAQCIAAYKKDPWTDFHSWVAEMVPTKRRPAKTINFMMGYGGGKARALQVLSLNKDVVGEVVAEIDKAGVRDEARASAIRQACEARAAQVFNKYHALLPELKSTSRMASNACRAKGFVRNHYGRRRHLPLEFSHRAFNAACQSTAGDMMKERMVALEKEVPEFLMTMQVHDQVVGVAPLEMLKDDSLLKRIVNVMNAPERPLIIPIRTSIGWSDTSWGHASKEERELKFT
jgi:DNA polymerase-1